MTAAPLRVVSLLPSATDTVLALDYGHVLVGRSHECDAPGLQHLPALTSSRVGNIPVDEIDAVMSASAAAVRELAQLGATLAVPLLEYGLCVYHLHLEQLQQLRPDVVLTCLQAAHGAVLSDGLLEAALHSVLGYAPRVVHCAAERLDGVWRDMQAVADGLEVPERGRAVVEKHRQHLADVAASARGRGSLRVAAIQWPQPLMACGAWVPEMIKMAGSRDVCGAVDHAEVVSEQQLGTAAPDVVIFALCGLTLEQSLQAARATIRRLADTWPSLPAARAGRVAVVDGEHVFSRPGPLLSQSMEVLMELMHPEVQPYGHQGFRPAKPRPRLCEPLRQHHEGRLPARTPGPECLRHRCQRWPPHQVCWLWRLSGRMQRGMGLVLRGRRACCRDSKRWPGCACRSAGL